MTFQSALHFQYLNRKSRWIVLIVLLIFSCTASSALANSPYIARPEQQSPEQAYTAAKAYLQQLGQNHTIGNNRNNWLTSARTFRQIHLTEKKESLGPLSLYMSARTYQLMFDRFKQPQDLVNAQSTFLELADLYPAHFLADDALFAAAQCAQQRSEQRMAGELYQKIISLYPEGDQAVKAQTILAAHTVKSTNNSPDQKENLSSLPSSPPSLSPAKYWSSQDYCRVVLQAPGPLTFTNGIVTQTGDETRLISFDIKESHVTGNYLHSQPVSQGLLKRIVSRPLDADTVRVSVEVESLAEYSIFSLNDPFRIVVDVRGTQATTPPPASSASSLISAADSYQLPKPAKSTRLSTELLAADPGEQKRRPAAGKTPAIKKGNKRETLSLAQQLGLVIRKITIDPGHGGKDP
ncbi:MAG: hypothetical protein GXY53_02090, partial [Desulfobulbus sp.]|nr:hypothetical protein [Desulfobulbus sp.]